MTNNHYRLAAVIAIAFTIVLTMYVRQSRTSDIAIPDPYAGMPAVHNLVELYAVDGQPLGNLTLDIGAIPETTMSFVRFRFNVAADEKLQPWLKLRDAEHRNVFARSGQTSGTFELTNGTAFRVEADVVGKHLEASSDRQMVYIAMPAPKQTFASN